MQQEPLATTDQFSREATRRIAREAARGAVADFTARVNHGRREGDLSLSRFALHTWGVVAAMSLIVGVSASLIQQPDPFASLAVTISKRLNDVVRPKQAAVVQTVPEAHKQATAPLPKSQKFDFELAGSLRLNEPLDETVTGSVSSAPERPRPPGPSIGMVISVHKSADILKRRYSALLQREPGLFAGLEPIIEPNSDKIGDSLALTAGPFASSEEAANFCREIQLRLTLTCSPTVYLLTNGAQTAAGN